MLRLLATGIVAVVAIVGAGACTDDGPGPAEAERTPSTATDAPAAAPPQPVPWASGPPDVGVAEGAPDGVLVVGDSLVAYSDVDTLAAQVTRSISAETLVVAAPGASWVTFGRPGLQNGNDLVWGYAEDRRPTVTVVALATNDARIITQYPADYSATEQATLMDDSVARTLEHSECVVLVTVAGRDDVPGMSRAATTAVNGNMATLAAAEPDRVRVADWEAHADGQTDWFEAGDVHFTQAGYTAYRDFLTVAVRDAVDAGC